MLSGLREELELAVSLPHSPSASGPPQSSLVRELHTTPRHGCRPVSWMEGGDRERDKREGERETLVMRGRISESGIYVRESERESNGGEKRGEGKVKDRKKVLEGICVKEEKKIRWEGETREVMRGDKAG